MSQENVEVVRAIYECSGAGRLPYYGRQGRAGFRMESKSTASSSRALTLEQTRTAHCEASSRFTRTSASRPRNTSTRETPSSLLPTLRAQVAEAVCTWTNGWPKPGPSWTGHRLVVEQYPSRKDALEAVGLSEQDAQVDA